MLKRLFKKYKERIKQEPFRQAAIIAAVLIILTSFFIHQYIPPVISWSLIAVCLVIIITSEKWNILFFISCIVAGIFLFVPFWLESPQNYAFISDVLKTLMTSDYKSTYGESIGSLIGTFLAIFGALWTQHYFEQQKEARDAIENARVIYYDFKFAFSEVRDKLQKFLDKQRITEANYTKEIFEQRDPYKAFDSYQISIDRDWIRNVSRLPDCFTTSEIEDIYYVYGAITALNLALSSGGSSVNDPLLKFYAIIPGVKTIKANRINPDLAEREKKTLEVWNKLKDAAKIID